MDVGNRTQHLRAAVTGGVQPLRSFLWCLAVLRLLLQPFHPIFMTWACVRVRVCVCE